MILSIINREGKYPKADGGDGHDGIAHWIHGGSVSDTSVSETPYCRN